MFWSCGSKACRILAPQPEWNLHPLPWKVKSQPLHYQGRPIKMFYSAVLSAVIHTKETWSEPKQKLANFLLPSLDTSISFFTFSLMLWVSTFTVKQCGHNIWILLKIILTAKILKFHKNLQIISRLEKFTKTSYKSAFNEWIMQYLEYYLNNKDLFFFSKQIKLRATTLFLISVFNSYWSKLVIHLIA